MLHEPHGRRHQESRSKSSDAFLKDTRKGKEEQVLPASGGREEAAIYKVLLRVNNPTCTASSMGLSLTIIEILLLLLLFYLVEEKLSTRVTLH